MSLKKFETFLQEQEFGMEKELNFMKNQYRTRVDGIRAQTSLRIEALEAALTECKISMIRERERAEQQLAEMESTVYNQYITNQQDDGMERVHKIESELNKPYYKEIDDRRKVKMLEKCVKRLSDAIRGYQQDKILYTKTIKDLNYETERHD